MDNNDKDDKEKKNTYKEIYEITINGMIEVHKIAANFLFSEQTYVFFFHYNFKLILLIFSRPSSQEFSDIITSKMEAIL